MRQLLAQLEWQCSEHEALVVLEVGDDPTRVSHGWQLVSYVNTLADDEDARDRFLQHDPVVRERFAESDDDPFDFFFDHLLDNYLDNPDSVAEQAGVEIATSRRSAEQLEAERDSRSHFVESYAELRARAVPALEVKDERIGLAQRVRGSNEKFGKPEPEPETLHGEELRGPDQADEKEPDLVPKLRSID